MSKFVFETHCHSIYSQDSSLKIETIIKQCNKYGINGIVICDHDTFGLTSQDEALFRSNNIKVFRGIEFTTKEGVHIIGISNEISSLMQPKCYYRAVDLTNSLKTIGAKIIVPHPYHETGLLGNLNICDNDCAYVLRSSDFIELANFRYDSGESIAKIIKQYPNLSLLVGSDAHAKKAVGAYLNYIEDEGKLQPTYDIEKYSIKHFKRVHRWRTYWIKERIKKSDLYQRILRCFPVELRRRIKNCIFNK